MTSDEARLLREILSHLEWFSFIITTTFLVAAAYCVFRWTFKFISWLCSLFSTETRVDR